MAEDNYNLSRTEEMLNAMIDGSSYSTGYIQSRVEKILQAIIDGTPYTDEPQSRIEELLIDILEGGGGKLYVPQALISAYQQHTKWATLLNNNPNNQILAIEGSIYE